MQGPPLRLAFLVGTDSESTRLTIDAVCRLPMVDPVAVLLDTARPGWIRRVKNLRRNVDREGWSYIPYRLLAAARALTDRLAYNAAVSRQDVLDLLRKAFPERCFSLEELGRRYGFDVRCVGNLNGPEAVRVLAACDADLGIVVGNSHLAANYLQYPQAGKHQPSQREGTGVPGDASWFLGVIRWGPGSRSHGAFCGRRPGYG